VITGSGSALILTNVLNSTVTQNEISGSTGPNRQVGLTGGDNNILFTQNCIEDGAARGIRLQTTFDSANTPDQNITFTGNSIEGNALAGLEIDAGAYVGGTGSLSAQNNWWGSATGPTNTLNPGGTGQAIVDPANQVNFVPFLTSGDDLQLDVRGCQLAG